MGNGVSAMNDSSFGWVGSLLELSGTEGYWFKTIEEVSFIYNPPAEGGMARQTRALRTIPEIYMYDQSMQQAFYFVDSATIDGKPLEEEDLIIAYNGDVVIGARYWYDEVIDVPAMGFDSDLIYTSEYAKPGDYITFKVFDASEDMLIDMDVVGNTSWQNYGMTIIQMSNLSLIHI